jgi:hypothetical protein
MQKNIKKIIKKTFPYIIFKKLKNKNILYKWEKEGKPYPPPHLVKQILVKDFAKKFSIETLVETGTYHGDMVWATIDTFKEIISVELDKQLFLENQKKFSQYSHVSIIHGDSEKIIKKILSRITSSSIFWLDGHTSPGFNPPEGSNPCPIKEELHTIFSHHIKDHIILIDDAHDFNGTYGYPTILELKNITKKNNPKSTFLVRNNIIIISK